LEENPVPHLLGQCRLDSAAGRQLRREI